MNSKDSRPIEVQLAEALGRQITNEEKIISALDELLKWVKVTGHSQVGAVLNQQVRTATQKIVYANSDGVKTLKELAELSGGDPGNISRDWKQWTQVGITEQVPARGGSRGKSLFNLVDFGIDVPKSTISASADKAKQELKEEQPVE